MGCRLFLLNCSFSLYLNYRWADYILHPSFILWQLHFFPSDTCLKDRPPCFPRLLPYWDVRQLTAITVYIVFKHYFLSSFGFWIVNSYSLTRNLTFTKPIINQNEKAASILWQQSNKNVTQSLLRKAAGNTWRRSHLLVYHKPNLAFLATNHKKIMKSST